MYLTAQGLLLMDGLRLKAAALLAQVKMQSAPGIRQMLGRSHLGTLPQMMLLSCSLLTVIPSVSISQDQLGHLPEAAKLTCHFQMGGMMIHLPMVKLPVRCQQSQLHMCPCIVCNQKPAHCIQGLTATKDLACMLCLKLCMPGRPIVLHLPQ